MAKFERSHEQPEQHEEPEDFSAGAVPELRPPSDGPHVTAQDMLNEIELSGGYQAPEPADTGEHLPLPLGVERFEGLEPASVAEARTIGQLFTASTAAVAERYSAFVDRYTLSRNVDGEDTVVLDQRGIELEYRTPQGWANLNAYLGLNVLRLSFTDAVGKNDGIMQEYYISGGVLWRRNIPPDNLRPPLGSIPAAQDIETQYDRLSVERANAAWAKELGLTPGVPVGAEECVYLTELLEHAEPFNVSFLRLETIAQRRLAAAGQGEQQQSSQGWEEFDTAVRRRLADTGPGLLEVIADGDDLLRVEIGEQPGIEQAQPFVVIQYTTHLTDAELREWLGPDEEAPSPDFTLGGSHITISHRYEVHYDQNNNGSLVCGWAAEIRDYQDRVISSGSADEYTGDVIEARLIRNFLRKPHIAQ